MHMQDVARVDVAYITVIFSRARDHEVTMLCESADILSVSVTGRRASGETAVETQTRRGVSHLPAG